MSAPTSPIVAPGSGRSLPEKYAEKLAQQWLTDIDAQCHLRTLALMKFRDAAPLPGNGIATKRWLARYRLLAGPAAMAGWGQNFDREKGGVVIDKVGRSDIHKADDEIRVMRWQFFRTSRRSSLYPCHGAVCILSAPAISGLIREGDIRSSAEVLDFLASNWREIAAVSALSKHQDIIVPVKWRYSFVLLARAWPAFVVANGQIVRESDHVALKIIDVCRIEALPAGKASYAERLREALARDPSPAPGIVSPPGADLMSALNGGSGDE